MTSMTSHSVEDQSYVTKQPPPTPNSMARTTYRTAGGEDDEEVEVREDGVLHMEEMIGHGGEEENILEVYHDGEDKEGQQEVEDEVRGEDDVPEAVPEPKSSVGEEGEREEVKEESGEAEVSLPQATDDSRGSEVEDGAEKTKSGGAEDIKERGEEQLNNMVRDEEGDAQPVTEEAGENGIESEENTADENVEAEVEIPVATGDDAAAEEVDETTVENDVAASKDKEEQPQQVEDSKEGDSDEVATEQVVNENEEEKSDGRSSRLSRSSKEVRFFLTEDENKVEDGDYVDNENENGEENDNTPTDS